MVPQKPGIAFVDYETEARARLTCPHTLCIALASSVGKSPLLFTCGSRTLLRLQATVALMGLNGFKITDRKSVV